jgi:hypothetical protein
MRRVKLSAMPTLAYSLPEWLNWYRTAAGGTEEKPQTVERTDSVLRWSRLALLMTRVSKT